MNSNVIEETSYRLAGDFLANAAAVHLLSSFKRAMALDHKLHPAIVGMQGMSGRKYRYLINNLIETMADPRYLEIGSWMGSTACAAIFRNQLTAVCVDNWAQFGGPKEAFLSNVNAVKTDSVNFSFIERDFRQVDFSSIGKFNVYMFDGPHEEQDQYDGVFIAQPALDDCYVLIVDDWNWAAVRAGTLRGLADAKASVVCSIEIRTTQNDTQPTRDVFQNSDWHNGYFMSVCKKQSVQS